jgi:polysaccharide biosynthesis PFTS motif protein
MLNIINYFQKFLIKKKQRLLRKSIRGYKKIKQRGGLDFIRSIRIQIDEEKFLKVNKNIDKTIFYNSSLNPEICVRQFLLTNLILASSFNLKLLASVGDSEISQVFALPVEWRKVLARNNIKIKQFQSEIFWRLWCLKMYVRSIIKILYFLSLSLAIIFQTKKNINHQSVTFEGLSESCLPKYGADGLSYDVISWYLQWKNKARNIDTIYHSAVGFADTYIKDIKITNNNYQFNIPLLDDLKLFLYVLLWTLYAATIALKNLLLGRWWNSILLSESFLALVVNKISVEKLSRDYLFQSNWIYKPLWTYEAEEKGVRVIFYFYSTNSEGLKSQNGYKSIDFDWRSLTWKHYLVWDAYQENFLRQAIPDNKLIEVVGPIWFQNSGVELPVIKQKSIAVFDVQPHRQTAYHALGAPIEYYTPENCIKFMSEIYLVARDCGYELVWKRKRRIGRNIHPKFRNFVNIFCKLEGVKVVDEEVSAVRVINATLYNISMPYTSTALLGRDLGRKGCYYDSSGLILPDDKGSHGVKILSGVDDLKNWILAQEKIS